ncbi:MAG: hypothetical protein IMZ64_04075 [Bacteroidetes bacterium]|nr:hypothetical protein [Bacteroidota bacterium]
MYQVTIKVLFEAMDDIEARKIGNSIAHDNDIPEIHEDKAEIKIQEVYENKPPRGIAVNLTPER